MIDIHNIEVGDLISSDNFAYPQIIAENLITNSIYCEGVSCAQCPSSRSTIVGGYSNTLVNTSNSAIIGGVCNTVYSYISNSSLSGSLNILGGGNNKICSYHSNYYSTIIGGNCNTIGSSNYSAIIGGCCLTLSINNTVLVPSILTPNPSDGNSTGYNNWILGGMVSYCSTIDLTKYVEVSICGVIYKLATMQ